MFSGDTIGSMARPGALGLSVLQDLGGFKGDLTSSRGRTVVFLRQAKDSEGWGGGSSWLMLKAAELRAHQGTTALFKVFGRLLDSPQNRDQDCSST